MKIAALVLSVLALAKPIRAQELLTPVAMASSGETIYLAYADNTVWWAHGQILEIPVANRGVAISAICPDPSGVFVVYADNQAWFVQAPNVCIFRYDMTRPDDPARHVVQLSTGSGLVAAYDDGQIWAYTDMLRRVSMWERLNPASDVEDTPTQSSPTVAPNPTSGATTITFSLAHPGWTSVRIYDPAGRLVRTLEEGEMAAGPHTVTWDGNAESGEAERPGIYFSRVQTGAGVMSGRVVRR